MCSEKKKIFLFGYSATKKGATRNEDAHYPKNFAEVEKGAVMAVADGASSAIFSGEWAETLVSATVHKCRSAKLQDLQERTFVQKIKEICESYRPATAEDNLFIKNKFLQVGSHATFLWAQVEAQAQSSHLVWAIAVGDSCLIKLHAGKAKVTGSFPLERVEEFGTTPPLISNRSQDAPQFKQTLWTVDKNEILLLASDAMAKWILSMDAGGRGKLLVARITTLLQSREKFEEFVMAQRESKECPLENDDTTLVACIPLPLYRKMYRKDNFLATGLSVFKVAMILLVIAWVLWGVISRVSLHRKLEHASWRVAEYFDEEGKFKAPSLRDEELEKLEFYVESWPDYRRLKESQKHRDDLESKYAQHRGAIRLKKGFEKREDFLQILGEIEHAAERLAEIEKSVRSDRVIEGLREKVAREEDALIAQLGEKQNGMGQLRLEWNAFQQQFKDYPGREETRELTRYFDNLANLCGQYQDCRAKKPLQRLRNLYDLNAAFDSSLERQEIMAQKLRQVSETARREMEEELTHLRRRAQEMIEALEKMQQEILPSDSATKLAKDTVQWREYLKNLGTGEDKDIGRCRQSVEEMAARRKKAEAWKGLSDEIKRLEQELSQVAEFGEAYDDYLKHKDRMDLEKRRGILYGMSRDLKKNRVIAERSEQPKVKSEAPQPAEGEKKYPVPHLFEAKGKNGEGHEEYHCKGLVFVLVPCGTYKIACLSFKAGEKSRQGLFNGNYDEICKEFQEHKVKLSGNAAKTKVQRKLKDAKELFTRDESTWQIEDKGKTYVLVNQKDTLCVYRLEEFTSNGYLIAQSVMSPSDLKSLGEDKPALVNARQWKAAFALGAIKDNPDGEIVSDGRSELLLRSGVTLDNVHFCSEEKTAPEKGPSRRVFSWD